MDGSPFRSGSSPESVTVGPNGQFVYVSNTRCILPTCDGDGYVYSVDARTGAPTQVPGSPFVAGHWAQAVTVDATGQFVHAANYYSGDVSAYTVDGTTGALTEVPGSPFKSGDSPYSVVTTAGPQTASVPPLSKR